MIGKWWRTKTAGGAAEEFTPGWGRPPKGGRHYWPGPQCWHDWTPAGSVQRLVAGRMALEARGVCKKCGESGIISTLWLEHETDDAPDAVTVTLTRREYDALLSLIPTARSFHNAAVRFDMDNLRDKLTAAGRPR